jgi:hypothetical protein
LACGYGSKISYPVTPANLVNFGEAVNFPLILGLELIVFGVDTLVHALVLSVARRRRERSSASSWLCRSALHSGGSSGRPSPGTSVSCRWRWSPDAPSSRWPVGANVLAIGPALVATRSHPAILLSSE